MKKEEEKSYFALAFILHLNAEQIDNLRTKHTSATEGNVTVQKFHFFKMTAFSLFFLLDSNWPCLV